MVWTWRRHSIASGIWTRASLSSKHGHHSHARTFFAHSPRVAPAYACAQHMVTQAYAGALARGISRVRRRHRLRAYTTAHLRAARCTRRGSALNMFSFLRCAVRHRCASMFSTLAPHARAALLLAHARVKSVTSISNRRKRQASTPRYHIKAGSNTRPLNSKDTSAKINRAIKENERPAKRKKRISNEIA